MDDSSGDMALQQLVPDLLRHRLAESGAVTLRVQGWSMWPALRRGEPVEVEACTVESLRPGDVVVVGRRSGDGRVLIVHRLLTHTGGQLVLRGDMRPDPDAPVDAADVIGVARRVQRRGAWRPIPGPGPVAGVLRGIENHTGLVSALRGAAQDGSERLAETVLSLPAARSLLRSLQPLGAVHVLRTASSAGNVIRLVAMAAGEEMGRADVEVDPASGIARLRFLRVRIRARGRGVGTALVSEAKRIADEAGVPLRAALPVTAEVQSLLRRCAIDPA